MPPPEAREGADPYEVLGVEEEASSEEIRAAFRRLNLELRPQVRTGGEEMQERFKDVLDAYRTLGDPERRRHYDLRVRSAA